MCTKSSLTNVIAQETPGNKVNDSNRIPPVGGTGMHPPGMILEIFSIAPKAANANPMSLPASWVFEGRPLFWLQRV